MFRGWRLVLWFACSGALWLGFRYGSPVLLYGAVLLVLPAYVPRDAWSRRFIKRVVEIRTQSTQARKSNLKRFHTWMGGQRNALEGWPVPPSMATLHRALILSVSLGAQGPMSGRYRSLISHRRFVEQLIRQLKARHPGGDEHTFLVQAEEWWAYRQQERDAYTREAQRALSAALDQIQRLRPSPKLRGWHAVLQKDLRAEYVATASLNESVDSGDVVRAISALNDLSAAQARVKDMLSGALKIVRRPTTDLTG